ncbi:MAG: helix-turn-helix transcriptional regulator [Bifidobacterium sp.]|nr:helix-turn-helix transcriptional regulator [Bifidobacterium sp.]
METTAAFRQAMAQIMKGRMAFHGVQQAETAEAIGISQSQLSKILRADRPIDLETFEALCTFLGDDAAALVAQGRALADRSATNDNTDKSQDALADANTADRVPDMSGWTVDEQATYIAEHLDQFDYAAKRGDTEAEQEAYEDLP